MKKVAISHGRGIIIHQGAPAESVLKWAGWMDEVLRLPGLVREHDEGLVGY
jgi:hypothetical protein